MMAHSIGEYCVQPTTDERIVNIGWTAPKAILWNAQRFPVSYIKAACEFNAPCPLTPRGNAAPLLNDSLPQGPKYEPRQMHAKFFSKQAELLTHVTCAMFINVPHHFRSAFFRMNVWNEHYEGC